MALPRALWRGPWPLRALLCPALPPAPRAGLRPPARSCSGDSGGGKARVRLRRGQISVEVVGIWQPRKWLRTRIRSFLIRTFLDHDFSLKDFTRGSKQVSARPPHPHTTTTATTAALALPRAAGRVGRGLCPGSPLAGQLGVH